jgi:ABC-2 type transport system ATP-binding protein
MPETMVEARALSKVYTRKDGTKVQAVKNIDLDIYKGEIFSLLGPNGAGKSTTISMISGLIEPTSGEAKIGGYSISKQPLDAKKLIGVVPQDIALYPTLSARQNLEFFGRMYSLGGAELGKRVDEVLEFIDLKDRQKDKIETFSGGMKRRVNIGVGLLHRPQLVYMDEPTVGIDPQNRRRILDTVFRLRDEYKMTVLYTTHLMEESQELSDRVGIIDHGEIIAMGTVGELTQKVGEEDSLILKVGQESVPNSLLEDLQKVEGVTRTLYDAPQQVVEGSDKATDGQVTVFANRGRKALPQVIHLTNEAGVDVLSVEVREPDLEAVFLHLTGRALRD